MKKSTLFSILTILILIPATLYLGTHLTGRWYYLTSTLIIVENMVPFFLAFENRKPQARELVTLAVMAALAVAGRVAIPIPSFKAITAIIMITGIAFGGEAGFLTGAVAAFASNFFYGQGPWTPWQMMAYGIGGFLAGILFYKQNRKYREKAVAYTVGLAFFGFAAIVCLVGPLLDSCTIFTAGSEITPAFAASILASGLPVNITHGLSCAVTMLLLSRPLLDKLDRLKTKYGMMEAWEDGI